MVETIPQIFLPHLLTFMPIKHKHNDHVYVFHIHIKDNLIIKIISTIDELILESEFLKNQINKINFDKYLKIRNEFYGEDMDVLFLQKYEIVNLDIVVNNFDFEEYEKFKHPDFKFNPYKLNFSLLLSFHTKQIFRLSKDNNFIKFIMNDDLSVELFPQNEYICSVYVQLKLLFYYCEKLGLKNELLDTIEKGVLFS